MGLPEITMSQVIYEAERDVIAKAMDATRKTLRLGKCPDGEHQKLSQLVDESVDADLALQDACSLLADLKGVSLTEED